VINLAAISGKVLNKMCSRSASDDGKENDKGAAAAL
jgi:hypothetical protein